MRRKVFISYVRKDRPFAARAIEQTFANVYGRKSAFLDVAAILPGQNYPEVLADWLDSVNVMIVVIGERWLSNLGRNDLKNWVKDEVAQALKRDIPTIPVLVGDVELPPKAALPPELRSLENFIPFRLRPDFPILQLKRLVVEVELRLRGREGKRLLEMANIPAGEFRMGQEPSRGYGHGKDVKITVSFQMGVFPVTVEEYRIVEGIASEDPGELTRLPATFVSWYEAVEFCNHLSEIESLQPYYEIHEDSKVVPNGGSGYRLPTEAEWEYACRGATGVEEVRMEDREVSVNDPNRLQLHPVDEKEPNGWGLYDIQYNADEWCWDYYKRQFRVKPREDPMVSKGGKKRVVRGGGIRWRLAYAK